MTDEIKLLWPPIDPHVRHQYSTADVKIYQNEEGKPVLKITLGNTGHAVYMTAHLAEMIGGVAISSRKRHEENYK